MVQGVHLRTLLQDKDRCYAMTAEHNGVVLDYSRQNATTETMDMLFDLASAAGLEEKRTRMGTGQHINNTEDRAVMHIALRAPRDKAFHIDGENVVPAVHGVLDRVRSACCLMMQSNSYCFYYRLLRSLPKFAMESGWAQLGNP